MMSAMSSDGSPDWEFKDRDIAILREVTRNPQVTSRELATILEEEYEISVSHTTVNESMRKMQEAGVFREAIIPNMSYFRVSLFEFKFHTWNFSDRWRDAFTAIRDDPNTLLYFLASGEYQWMTIMIFPNLETESRWVHELYKEYGDIIAEVRNRTIYSVAKFQTDPEVFESLHDRGPRTD